MSLSDTLFWQKHDVNKLCARMSLTEIFTSSFDQLDEMIVATLKVGDCCWCRLCVHAMGLGF